MVLVTLTSSKTERKTEENEIKRMGTGEIKPAGPQH